MARWSSDSKSRASKKAKDLHAKLKAELVAKKQIKPEQENIPNKQPWYVGN